MKLTQKFEKLLKENFSEVIVIDERGDGHHVELVVIDKVFVTKNRLQRSRWAFEKLGSFVKQVHAVTVKCFTPEEWKEKKENFEQVEYVHLR